MKQVIDFGFIFNDEDNMTKLGYLLATYFDQPYWGQHVDGTAEGVINGGKLTVEEMDDDGTVEATHVLTLDKFLQGAVRFALERLINDHDVIDADCVLQYALLDELRYG